MPHVTLCVYVYTFIGKRFASAMKLHLRCKHARSCNDTKFLLETDTSSNTSTLISNVDSASQPSLQVVEIGDQSPSTDDQHVKLPENSQDNTAGKQLQQPDPVIYETLLAKIELLEAENLKLKKHTMKSILG